MGRVCRGLRLSFERRPGVELRTLSPQERGYGTSPWSGGEFESGLTGLMLSRRCRFRTVSAASANCSLDVQQAWVGGTDVGIERVPADQDMDFF